MLAMQQRVAGDGVEHHAEPQYRGPIDIVRFAAWHLDYIDVRPEQWAVVPNLSADYGRALELTGGGFSAFDGPSVIAVAGIVPFWEGRAQVWALMAPGMTARGLVISRAVKRYLKAYHCTRLECVIDPEFEESVKWAKWLGFQFESPMPYYRNGRTMDMYVRLEP